MLGGRFQQGPATKVRLAYQLPSGCLKDAFRPSKMFMGLPNFLAITNCRSASRLLREIRNVPMATCCFGGTQNGYLHLLQAARKTSNFHRPNLYSSRELTFSSPNDLTFSINLPHSEALHRSVISSILRPELRHPEVC